MRWQVRGARLVVSNVVLCRGRRRVVVVVAEYVVSHLGAPLVFYRGGFSGLV